MIKKPIIIKNINNRSAVFHASRVIDVLCCKNSYKSFLHHTTGNLTETYKVQHNYIDHGLIASDRKRRKKVTKKIILRKLLKIGSPQSCTRKGVKLQLQRITINIKKWNISGNFLPFDSSRARQFFSLVRQKSVNFSVSVN